MDPLLVQTTSDKASILVLNLRPQAVSWSSSMMTVIQEPRVPSSVFNKYLSECTDNASEKIKRTKSRNVNRVRKLQMPVLGIVNLALFPGML